MDIFDDFDSEGKGYLKHAQIQHAYKEIFNESRKISEKISYDCRLEIIFCFIYFSLSLVWTGRLCYGYVRSRR